MAILRYTASADNTITNAFDETIMPVHRATGSNMGKSDALEVFGIYGQYSSSAGITSEISRTLVKFDVTQLNADRTAESLPAQGSVNFYLKLYNVPHSATWTFTDKPNEATTIKLTDYEGTSVTFEVNNDGDSVSGTNVSMDPAANSGAGMATILFSSVNASALKITATNPSSGVVLLTQDKAGSAGNKTITLSNYSNWNSNTSATFPTAFTDGSDYTPWTSFGGDFSIASNNFVDATMIKGTENLEVDVTTIVENWLGDSPTNSNYGFMIKLSSSYEPYFSESSGTSTKTATHNVDGAKRSYYTKKFFGRGTEYFFKRPTIEARWDGSKKDDRGNIYLSSSLAPQADNLNAIYMYNYVRGKLTDIKGSNSEVPNVKFYYSSDSTPEGTPRTFIENNASKTSVNGARISTGLYKVSFAINKDQFPEGYPYLVDVWSHEAKEIHTGSAMLPKSFGFSNINPNSKYVLSIANMREWYNNLETARFRIYSRLHDWSPTVHTIASNIVETSILPSASYEIYRVIDEAVVIPYGTGSSPSHTMLSHDVSGNYFDLDMSLLEAGYSYGIRISIYESSITSWREQPYTFKFRVDKHEY